jgi:hypothetical protein
MRSFQSVFAGHLSAYIKLRRDLGFRFEDGAFFLEAFDGFVFERQHAGPLTQELAVEFASINPKTTSNYCARRYQVVRHFSLYLATFHPQTPVLDAKALRQFKARNPRHIYTDQELRKILRSSDFVSIPSLGGPRCALVPRHRRRQRRPEAASPVAIGVREWWGEAGPGFRFWCEWTSTTL